MAIESKIFLNEKVKNKNRLFGSTTEYFPVYIMTGDGREFPGLLTANELQTAMDRAERNPEDVPERDRGFFDWITGR